MTNWADIDTLIHDRIRLGIISALAVNDTLSFNDLKAILNATDGNLSVHARKLEDAEYIICHKSFEGRKPKSDYRLTLKGRKSLEIYLAQMEEVIKGIRG